MKKSSGRRKVGDGGKSLATRSIHAGESHYKYADSITTPIVQSSTFTFRGSQGIIDYTQKGKPHYEYGR